MPELHSTENSPLEIYDTAYRLHYIDNRISEALKYYEILIKEFPDSNECGYAAVQIQKIKASGLVKDLKTSKSLHPVAIIALIFSIIAIGFAGYASYYFYTRYKTEQQQVKLALSALSKVIIGDDDEALKILTELKILAKNDILPFELSSDLYLKQQKQDQARSEYEIFFRLNPSVKPSHLQLSKMSVPDKKKNKNVRVPDKEIQQPVTKSNEGTQPESKAVIPVQTQTSEPKSKVVKPKQKSKNLFLVDPDSLSYF